MKRLNLVLQFLVFAVAAAASNGDEDQPDRRSPKSLKAIPERLVVLTFDDASKSHFTIARPVLLKHKFGATFFVTEGWDMPTNKIDYMSWDEIAQLHKDGFEIGNHTLGHMGITDKSLRDLPGQLRGIDLRCKEHAIPKPVSFAYPGNAFTREAITVLKEHGMLFARRGGSPEFPYKDGRGPAYEPGRDHPLFVPTTGDARPHWTIDDFQRVLSTVSKGQIAVLQFHGVPDTAHDWVNTDPERFTAFMRYLADENYTVIAMRDLATYVDPEKGPEDPFEVVEARKVLNISKANGAKSDGKGLASVFNGQNLEGWSGDPQFWSVEDGALTGVADGSLTMNRFITWTGGTLRNFDLRVNVKVSAGGNSGIQYRGKPRPDLGADIVTGYQCDVVANVPEYNGMLYEERGRRILSHTGEKVIVAADGQPWIVGKLPVKEFTPNEWHEYRVLVEGNHHRHWIDGHPTADLIDLDEKGRALEGVLAVQVHVGPAMKIQYKDFRLMHLADDLPLKTSDDSPIPAGSLGVKPQGKLPKDWQPPVYGKP